MKILVTGGAGFIASHVVDRMISLGHEVAVIDDLSTGLKRNLNPKATFYNMDIRDEKVAEVFAKEKPDVVDHHAAQMDVRRSVREPAYDASVNVLGSINLIENAQKHGVKKFIYISTGGAVYGEPQYLPADENHPVNPLCQYGISKHTVEHYLFLYRANYGMNYTVLRYPNVYGPRQNPKGEAGVNAIFIGMMMHGQTPTIYGDGEQLRDYVFVSDVVEGNVLALNKLDVSGIFNLGSAVGTSVNQIYQHLQKILGYKENAKYAEARVGEIDKIFLTGDKAREVLGWEPKVSFEEGLRKTVDFIKANPEWVA